MGALHAFPTAYFDFFLFAAVCARRYCCAHSKKNSTFRNPLMTRDRASSFRLKRGLFVYHDEIYSDFFLFRAQKRGILKKYASYPKKQSPKQKVYDPLLWDCSVPRLCGDNLPIFKSKRLHQIGVTPANAGKNCKTLCVSSIPFSRVTHIFK